MTSRNGASGIDCSAATPSCGDGLGSGDRERRRANVVNTPCRADTSTVRYCNLAPSQLQPIHKALPHTHACTHKHMYSHTHTHTHKHTHTHTCTRTRPLTHTHTHTHCTFNLDSIQVILPHTHTHTNTHIYYTAHTHICTAHSHQNTNAHT